MQDVPKIVRARLQRPSPTTADPHPDADLLTAFAEQSLAAQERDHVLVHLARCGECRDVVVLALPASEAAALTGSVGASVRTVRIGWFSWPSLRWAVVAAGILAVASVGIRQYSQHHQGASLVSFSVMPRDQIADTHAQNQPAPRAMAPAAVAPQAEMRKQTAMEKQTENTRQAPPPIRRPNSAVGIAGGSAARGGTFDSNAAPGSDFRFAPAPQNPAASASPNSTPAATSSIEVPGGPQVTAQTSAQNQVQDRLIQNQQAEPSQAVDFVYKAKSAPPQAFPPSMALALPRWTISASGTLQRSLDGGKTWLDVDVAANDSPNAARNDATTTTKSVQAKPIAIPRTIVRAVSVSSDAGEVWAGGSGGALYHTLDGGNRWIRVLPSDAGLVLTGDISNIQFSDPRNGTVTTSNAEVWTTVDSGQTWRKRP